MIMKINYKKIVFFAAIAIAVSACTKELNTKPTQQIDQAVALQTGNDVQVALIGAYTDLGNTNFISGQTAVDADLLGDLNEITWSGTFAGLTQMKNKTITIDNTFSTNAWLAGYKAINDVNNVLSAISVVAAKDTARVSGEAKFIRAVSYFELVKLFGKSWKDGDPAANPGVPIVLTPTRGITIENQVKRNTVVETYQQIISDLLDAESKLGNTNGFLATKTAASAMLSRVYLQKGDYANAAQAANRAITNSTANGGALLANFSDVFVMVNTAEDIFAIQVTATTGVNNLNTFYSVAGGRGDAQVTPNHLALYEAGDSRKAFFSVSGGSTYTSKFNIRFGNIHFIRLAEMYLIRAESNFRSGTSIGDVAVNDLNKIRARAKLAPLAAADLTLDNIIKDRKLELAFEGFTLHDIKRLQLPVGTLAWNAPSLVFPIPKRELVVNANLVQNDGYK